MSTSCCYCGFLINGNRTGITSTRAGFAHPECVEHQTLDAPKLRPLDYAQIINSLAFLTDEQRAGFFALLGASYCIHCGATAPCQDCPRHLPFIP